MNGAEWIVEFLKRNGTESVFGYPGGAIMPVYDALYRVGLKHLLCRHEQGAAMAAIGYARASGKTGVCLATSGPGALNLVTGLAEALADSVPLIAVTGQVGTAVIGTDAFQESDVLGWSLACTKHSFLVETISELPEILAEAFKLAKAVRPGPVLIDVPKDIQLAACDFPFPDEMQDFRETFSSSITLKDDLKAAAELLHRAKKPVVYVGGGVGMAGAVLDLRRFLDVSSFPSVVTLKALGTVLAEDPFYLGMLGMHGCKAANLAVQECDLLIALGARFDDRVTGKLEAFAPEAKIIHVDIDRSEMNKRRYADVQITDDLKEIIPLFEEIAQQESGGKRKIRLAPWHRHIKASKKTGSFFLKKQVDDQADWPIYAPSLLKTISEILPQNAVVTTDVGQHQMWSAQYMSFSEPENFITSGGMGTMGFGLPAAIGAQVARPQDRVVCISGDGSFMMNIQELATLKRGGNLPVKIVLLDNQRLGMVRQWQELFFEGRFSETILWDNPDFVHLAQAFGVKARHISKQGEMMGALKEMMETDGPYLLHVSVNSSQDVWPLVPPGAGNEVMLETIKREEI